MDYSPWSEREIQPNSKRSKTSKTGEATQTKLDTHAYLINNKTVPLQCCSIDTICFIDIISSWSTVECIYCMLPFTLGTHQIMHLFSCTSFLASLAHHVVNNNTCTSLTWCIVHRCTTLMTQQ